MNLGTETSDRSYWSLESDRDASISALGILAVARGCCLDRCHGLHCMQHRCDLTASGVGRLLLISDCPLGQLAPSVSAPRADDRQEP